MSRSHIRLHFLLDINESVTFLGPVLVPSLNFLFVEAYSGTTMMRLFIQRVRIYLRLNFLKVKFGPLGVSSSPFDTRQSLAIPIFHTYTKKIDSLIDEACSAALSKIALHPIELFPRGPSLKRCFDCNLELYISNRMMASSYTNENHKTK